MFVTAFCVFIDILREKISSKFLRRMPLKELNGRTD